MHMYVSILFRSRVMPVFLVFWGFSCSGVFLTPRIVAVALTVRNRTNATNSLDLLLGIKRMGEQTDEVHALFSNNGCIIHDALYPRCAVVTQHFVNNYCTVQVDLSHHGVPFASLE